MSQAVGLALVLGLPLASYLACLAFERGMPPAPPVAPQDAPSLGEAISGALGAAGALVSLLWALVALAVFLSPLLILIWLVTR